MAERAECVMLNKGPFIAEAIAILDDVLTRMEAHQLKKTPQLRALTGVIDGQALYDSVAAQLQHQYPLVSIGWVNHDTPFINWSQPNLKQAAKSLITAGAQTILFKPLGWVTDHYETILDVEDAIQRRGRGQGAGSGGK